VSTCALDTTFRAPHKVVTLLSVPASIRLLFEANVQASVGDNYVIKNLDTYHVTCGTESFSEFDILSTWRGVP
jgi:hypothetical protein